MKPSVVTAPALLPPPRISEYWHGARVARRLSDRYGYAGAIARATRRRESYINVAADGVRYVRSAERWFYWDHICSLVGRVPVSPWAAMRREVA